MKFPYPTLKLSLRLRELFIEDVTLITRLKYRPSINTLRAISVIGVLLYHFEYSLFEGGWLGVDVFFVISGYLISNIIFSELNNGTFKFKHFFNRRIKRIFPTLLLTSLVSLLVGYTFLSPLLLMQLSETARSGIFFYSNYFFSTLDFYTGGGVSKVFLLNYWSLSVEEQYYLIFPVILFLGYRLKNKKILVFSLMLIGVCSIVINFGGDINKFYFLQFRAWEFLAGVFINFIKKSNIKYLSELSLIFIGISFFYFDDSWITQIEPKFFVVIITAVFINNESTFITERLSKNKLLSIIGVSSYTIYLFHYPIFNFYKHYLEINFKVISTSEKLLLLAAILCLSFLTYHKFEKNFIDAFDIKKKFYLFILFLLNILLIWLFLNTNFLSNSNYSRFASISEKVYSYSIQENYEPKQNNKRCHNRDISNACFFPGDLQDNGDIYIIGDSQMINITYNLLSDPYFDSYNKTLYTKAGCIAVIIYNTCPDSSTKKVKEFLSKIQNSKIIYGGRVPLYLSDGNFYNGIASHFDTEYHSRDIDQFIKTIDMFLNNNNEVFFLFSIPNQAWNVTDLYFNNNFVWGDQIGYEYKYWQERIKVPISFISDIEHQNFQPIDAYKIFCNGIIQNYCVAAIDDNIFYSDYAHLTNEGSQLIIKKIKNKFSN